MPDPTNPNIPDTTQLDAATASSEQAASAFDNLNKIVQSTGITFESLNSQLGMSSIQIDSVSKSAGQTGTTVHQMEDAFSTLQATMATGTGLTDKQSQAMGLLTAKLLGTREAFTKLGGSIDSSRLNTLTGQWASMSDTILKSGGSIASIADQIQEKFSVVLPEAVKSGGIVSISDFMNTMMRATDNTLKLQNAIVQLSAQSGSLGEVFKTAGPNLENMNELVNQQRKAMIDSAEATSLLPEQMEQYYGQLGSIPGALSRTVGASNEILKRSSGDAQGRVSLLSASVLTAIGTGRQYTDVIQDLSVAFKNYGIVGEDALKFSTSISKISQDNHVDLESVQSAVRATAGEFSKFADTGEQVAQMSMSLTQSMNQYVTALENSGVPGNQAIGIFQNLTSVMGNMTTAQKAFLSQQTGGPGGLMGAFQIEKLMKTDPAAVLEKIRKQMEKMAGPAVSVEEAASSPAAAARLVRQREILKQGPLGQFAKTDQDASRILQAFKDIGTGAAKPSDFKDILEEPMNKGLALQEKSLTEAVRIRIANARLMASADAANTETVQGIFTASGASNQTTFNDMQKRLRAGEGAGAMASGMANQRFSQALTDKQVTTNTGNEEFLKSIQGIGDLYHIAAKTTEEFVARAKSKLSDEIGKAMRALPSTTGTAKEALMKFIEGKQTALKEVDELQARKAATGEDPFSTLRATSTPGQRVAAAATSTAHRLAGQTNPLTGGAATVAHAGVLPAAQGGHQIVDVNVKGVCIQCGRAMEENSHNRAVNPTVGR